MEPTHDRPTPGGQTALASQSYPHTDKLDEVYGLLQYLKVAVEDIRAQLSAHRKDHYTPEELGELVGRSAYTVRRWITEGRIRAVRIGGTGPKGRLLIPRDQLEALIAAGLGAAVPPSAVGSGTASR